MKTQELQKIIDDTRYARNCFALGYCIGTVSEKLNISPQTICKWIDLYAEPSNSHETLIASKFFKALVPIYVFPPRTIETPEPTPEFCGSGVLINVNSALFIVTAAHVVPSEQGFDIGIQMNDGGIHSLNDNGFKVLRKDYPGEYLDTIDVAAFDLSNMDQTPLNDFYTALEPNDIDLNEENIDGSVLTVAGYPASLQKSSVTAQPLALTGYADNIMPIRKYKYGESTNICMRFSMKSSSFRTGAKRSQTRPEGMSGGLILSWPQTFEKRANGGELKLIGIFHTWHKEINTLCGTRLSTVVSLIAQQFPNYLK